MSATTPVRTSGARPGRNAAPAGMDEHRQRGEHEGAGVDKEGRARRAEEQQERTHDRARGDRAHADDRTRARWRPGGPRRARAAGSWRRRTAGRARRRPWPVRPAPAPGRRAARPARPRRARASGRRAPGRRRSSSGGGRTGRRSLRRADRARRWAARGRRSSRRASRRCASARRRRPAAPRCRASPPPARRRGRPAAGGRPVPQGAAHGSRCGAHDRTAAAADRARPMITMPLQMMSRSFMAISSGSAVRARAALEPGSG